MTGSSFKKKPRKCNKKMEGKIKVRKIASAKISVLRSPLIPSWKPKKAAEPSSRVGG